MGRRKKARSSFARRCARATRLSLYGRAASQTFRPSRRSLSAMDRRARASRCTRRRGSTLRRCNSGSMRTVSSSCRASRGCRHTKRLEQRAAAAARCAERAGRRTRAAGGSNAAATCRHRDRRYQRRLVRFGSRKRRSKCDRALLRRSRCGGWRRRSNGSQRRASHSTAAARRCCRDSGTCTCISLPISDRDCSPRASRRSVTPATTRSRSRKRRRSTRAAS